MTPTEKPPGQPSDPPSEGDPEKNSKSIWDYRTPFKAEVSSSMDSLKRSTVVGMSSGSIAGLVAMLIDPKNIQANAKLAQLSILFGVAAGGLDQIFGICLKHYLKRGLDKAAVRRAMIEAEADETSRKLKSTIIKHEECLKEKANLEQRVKKLEDWRDRVFERTEDEIDEAMRREHERHA